MISVLSVDGQIILAATVLMPSVMAVINLVTLPRTAPTRFLHQEHHANTEDLIQSIDTPSTGETDHTPIRVPNIGDSTTDHSPTPVHTIKEAAALEGTPHALLSATVAAHAFLQLIDAPIIPHAMITTGIIAPHPAPNISPAGTTHTTQWTGASLAPATPAIPHKDLSPEKSSNAQDPQPLINPNIPKLSPSRILLQTLHQIMTVTLILLTTRALSQ